jgi:hypothetical protein
MILNTRNCCNHKQNVFLNTLDSIHSKVFSLNSVCRWSVALIVKAITFMDAWMVSISSLRSRYWVI